MKVIKPGKKDFIGNCSRCGCEFSYTLEELKAQYPLKFVHCPECDAEYYHPDQSNSSNESLDEYAFEQMVKDSLNFKQFSEGKHTGDADWSYYPTITSYCCPVCGEKMVVDTSVVLASNPPQYQWECPECGHMESHFCNDIVITKNSIGNPRVMHCSSQNMREGRDNDSKASS